MRPTRPSCDTRTPGPCAASAEKAVRGCRARGLWEQPDPRVVGCRTAGLSQMSKDWLED